MLASQNMRQDGTWGTHPEIIVAAALFRVFIIVQANQGGRPVCTGDPRNPPIFLFNEGEFHFEWMRPN